MSGSGVLVYSNRARLRRELVKWALRVDGDDELISELQTPSCTTQRARSSHTGTSCAPTRLRDELRRVPSLVHEAGVPVRIDELDAVCRYADQLTQLRTWRDRANRRDRELQEAVRTLTWGRLGPLLDQVLAGRAAFDAVCRSFYDREGVPTPEREGIPSPARSATA